MMKTLVAGIGNIFLGDDGFGVEVANRLSVAPIPPGVEVADYGIRGVHLAYQLLDGYDGLVLVDAMPMGESPGTIAIIEPDLDALSPPVSPADGAVPTMDAHSMNPAVVLGMLSGMGGSVGRVLVVGCEPANLDEGIGLSPPVAEAVDRAVEAVGEVLLELGHSNEEKTRA